jgi:hypothetical protein
MDATVLGLSPPASEFGEAAPAPNAGSPLLPPPTMKVHQRMVVRFVKALTYAYGLILLAGIWCLRRNLWRTDTLPFFFVTLVMFFGIWIRYNVLPIDERYYFTILLVSLPGLAIGAMQIAEWLARLARAFRRTQFHCVESGRSETASYGGDPGRSARRFHWRRSEQRPAILLALLAVVAVASAIDAVRVGGNMFRAWQEQADLGKWILRQRGPRQPLTGNNEEMRLVAYYAEGYLVPLSMEQLCGLPPPWPGPAVPPSVMVFWDDRRHEAGPNRYRPILDGQADISYRQVPPAELPPSCRDLTVMIHRSAAQPPLHTAARAPLPR